MGPMKIVDPEVEFATVSNEWEEEFLWDALRHRLRVDNEVFGGGYATPCESGGQSKNGILSTEKGISLLLTYICNSLISV